MDALAAGGDKMTLAHKRGHGTSLRRRGGSEPSDFPEARIRSKNGQELGLGCEPQRYNFRCFTAVMSN